MRRIGAVVVFGVALAACGAVRSAVDEIVPSNPPGGKQGGAGPAGSAGTGAPGSGTQARFDDDGGLGTMARTFLRAKPARRLTVEVDFIKGREPSSRALSHLADVLRGVASKPDGIGVSPGNEIAAGRERWTIGEIKALEASHRSAHSGGSTATMWIVYLDGAYADDESALGVAVSASAAAIFRDRIDDASTALIDATAVERAVITHETGHLLALINIGYRSAIDHEDADHPYHSGNRDSVMYWAVEDVSLKSLLTGGPPATFDDADKADLEAMKKG